MPFLFLILFIGVPIAEIALFIEIGGQIGLGWTLLSIFATAAIGTLLVRWQGLQTMARARAAMACDELPVAEVLAGVCILIAAALLLTPGFLTDAIGFALLIPPLRQSMAAAVVGHLKRSGKFRVHTQGGGRPGGPSGGPAGGRGPIIDGEFEEVSPDDRCEADPNSPWRKDGRDGIEGPEKDGTR